MLCKRVSGCSSEVSNDGRSPLQRCADGFECRQFSSRDVADVVCKTQNGSMAFNLFDRVLFATVAIPRDRTRGAQLSQEYEHRKEVVVRRMRDVSLPSQRMMRPLAQSSVARCSCVSLQSGRAWPHRYLDRFARDVRSGSQPPCCPRVTARHRRAFHVRQ